MWARLGEVRSTYEGFEELIRLHQFVKPCADPVVEVEMAGWIDGNMCAPLGALLYPLARAPREIRLPGLPPDREAFLQKNGFLANFGFNRPKTRDTFGTAIEYQRFEIRDTGPFKAYVEHYFVGKGIPVMSPALVRKFRESISELFDNAADHSGTQLGVFACGQYFPRLNRLRFSLADLGIGMRENILQKMEWRLTPDEAIQWAVSEKNTTRRHKPGGWGLKLIKEFIRVNQGRIQIVSDAGYWSFTAGGEELRTFSAAFPGTVVTIEINTADPEKYCLASEIDTSRIF